LLAWLTARFGQYRLLPATTPPDRAADQAAATPAFAVPVLKCDNDLSEGPDIMVVDGDSPGNKGEQPRSPAGAVVVLRRRRITGGRYPEPQDGVLTTSRWIERCQSAYCHI